MDVGKRYLSIKVWVSELEIEQLRAQARAHGRSVSSFLRWRALYMVDPPPLDLAAGPEEGWVRLTDKQQAAAAAEKARCCRIPTTRCPACGIGTAVRDLARHLLERCEAAE